MTRERWLWTNLENGILDFTDVTESISDPDRLTLENAIVDAGLDDYLDVWYITRVAQRKFPSKPASAVRHLVMEALASLINSGRLRVGHLVSPGEFVASTEPPPKAIARIRSQLLALNREPAVGEIAWFSVA